MFSRLFILSITEFLLLLHHDTKDFSIHRFLNSLKELYNTIIFSFFSSFVKIYLHAHVLISIGIYNSTVAKCIIDKSDDADEDQKLVRCFAEERWSWKREGEKLYITIIFSFIVDSG